MERTEFIRTYKWMNALRGGVVRDVYALIYQIGQRGVVSISANYICDRLGYSARGVQKAITELKETGWLEVEYTDGKRSVFKALTPEQSAGVTYEQCAGVTHEQRSPLPTNSVRTSHEQRAGVTPYISSEKDLEYPPTPPCAYARERLKKWVKKSDLKEWAERMLARNKIPLEVEAILDDFFDNDFKVRERCGQNDRIDVLTHFQNWLPKYIQKLKNDNNPTNNNTSNNGNNTRNPQTGGNAPTNEAQRKPYSRVQELANTKFDID